MKVIWGACGSDRSVLGDAVETHFRARVCAPGRTGSNGQRFGPAGSAVRIASHTPPASTIR
jgi:hypothetical protein